MLIAGARKIAFVRDGLNNGAERRALGCLVKNLNRREHEAGTTGLPAIKCQGRGWRHVDAAAADVGNKQMLHGEDRDAGHQIDYV